MGHSHRNHVWEHVFPPKAAAFWEGHWPAFPDFSPAQCKVNTVVFPPFIFWLKWSFNNLCRIVIFCFLKKPCHIAALSQARLRRSCSTFSHGLLYIRTPEQGRRSSVTRAHSLRRTTANICFGSPSSTFWASFLKMAREKCGGGCVKIKVNIWPILQAQFKRKVGVGWGGRVWSNKGHSS